MSIATTKLVIELNHIQKSYKLGEHSKCVLEDINLKISSGEMVSIMGASGSGKSTLMNILGLLDRPSSGRYLFQKNDVCVLSDRRCASIRNESIGFIFQQFHLLPRLSVYENVALPLYYADVSRDIFRSQILDVLEKVGMKHYLDYKPSMLSGGQQQRVAIARALVRQPKLILADEPTGALDSKTSDEIMHIFHDLHQRQNTTIVIITHDKSISQQCQREVFLKDGLIVSDLVL